MINFVDSLISFLKSTFLSWQRWFDHTFRRLIGVPTLRYSQITPQLYLGGQYSSRGFRILKSRGITGIVSMRMQAHKGLPDLGETRFLHLPTVDMEPPSLEHLHKGVEFITREIKGGGKVYVHCAAGEGRGPSMVAAYLVSTGLTVEDALTQIRAVRKFIRPNIKQVSRIKEFEKEWKKKNSN